MQIVPKLLRLCWFGFPLHHAKKGGWGFLVKKPVTEESESSRAAALDELDNEPESDENLSKFPYKLVFFVILSRGVM